MAQEPIVTPPPEKPTREEITALATEAVAARKEWAALHGKTVSVETAEGMIAYYVAMKKMTETRRAFDEAMDRAYAP